MSEEVWTYQPPATAEERDERQRAALAHFQQVWALERERRVEFLSPPPFTIQSRSREPIPLAPRRCAYGTYPRGPADVRDVLPPPDDGAWLVTPADLRETRYGKGLGGPERAGWGCYDDDE